MCFSCTSFSWSLYPNSDVSYSLKFFHYFYDTNLKEYSKLDLRTASWVYLSSNKLGKALLFIRNGFNFARRFSFFRSVHLFILSFVMRSDGSVIFILYKHFPVYSTIYALQNLTGNEAQAHIIHPVFVIQIVFRYNLFYINWGF